MTTGKPKRSSKLTKEQAAAIMAVTRLEQARRKGITFDKAQAKDYADSLTSNTAMWLRWHEKNPNATDRQVYIQYQRALGIRSGFVPFSKIKNIGFKQWIHSYHNNYMKELLKIING